MTAVTKAPGKPRSKPAKGAKPDATEKARKAALKEVSARVEELDKPATAEPTAGAMEVPAKPAGKGKKEKKAKEEKTKALGGLDAAALVLKEANEPLTVKQIWARIDERRLWFTEGRTPAATLYSAIIREIAAKKDSSRFRKTARGTFELAR